MDTPVTERLKALRGRAGISQAAAAAALGMSLGGYQRYENPERYKRPYLPLEVAEPLARLAAARGGDYGEWLRLAGIDPQTQQTRGLADVEMTPFEPDDASPLGAAIVALQRQNVGTTPWQIRGRALAAAGYLPGDIVLVDPSVTLPKTGDIVVAQLYDWDTGSARTVIRQADPPFLLAASPEPQHRRPLLIDDSVQVKGIVVASLRVSR